MAAERGTERAEGSREARAGSAAEPAWRIALTWALRLGLGGLLVWSGVAKVGDPASFAAEIGNYRLLPGLAPFMAVTLPPVEIVLGLALIGGPRVWVRAAALGATAILGVFTIAVISVVARGLDVDCGCFGTGSSPVTMLTVVRDLVLVAAAVGVFLLAREPEGSAPTAGEEQVGAPG